MRLIALSQDGTNEAFLINQTGLFSGWGVGGDSLQSGQRLFARDLRAPPLMD